MSVLGGREGGEIKGGRASRRLEGGYRELKGREIQREEERRTYALGGIDCREMQKC